ncbi:triose-phosphate isomerase [Patescibacteria group bacterium]|nr:triose-phosphate isomerase [Patescibacteria group bacterium]
MKKLIIGNWKMNPKSETEALAIVEKIKKALIPIVGIDLILCPPAVYLDRLYEEVRLTSIKLGAQNAHERNSGAFTGEISIPMIKKWVRYVILGHSERREIYKEDDKTINKKVINALIHNVSPILCVGETIKEMRMGDNEVIIKQLREDLKLVSPKDMEKMIFAYEPIWAIGKERGADPQYANQQIGLMRQAIASFYNRDLAIRARILYGGSVNASTVKDYLDQPEVNGVLVGGSSVVAAEFIQICKIAMGK